MSRFEWLIVVVLFAIASAVTLGHLEGTRLGSWLSGDPLPAFVVGADDRVFYAIPLLALLIWWSASLFPRRRDFLVTGAFVLVGIGIAYALYLWAA